MRASTFRGPGRSAAGWFALSLLVAVTLLGAPPTVRGEFKIGGKLPPFSLKSVDGAAFALERKQGRVVVTQGARTSEPKLLVLHLLQPDCLQCQAQVQELETLYQDLHKDGVLVVGIAHRGNAEAARVFAERLKLSFPVLVGTGSEFAKQFAGGDSLAIADETGVVRFAQVGYGRGDEKVWRADIERLLAGKPVARETIARMRLQVGDRFPVIELASVTTGKTITLSGEGGRLTFHDDAGKVSHPKAAVGFFSRYWTFSREEMVHLQKFQEKYAKDGLFVFAIAMLPGQEKVKKLTRDLGVTYPVFYGSGSDLGKLYAYGWPAYIVDAGGVIRYTQVGFEQGNEKKYEQVIQELLSAKSESHREKPEP